MTENPQGNQYGSEGTETSPRKKKVGMLKGIFGDFWSWSFWKGLVCKAFSKAGQMLVEAALIAFGEGIIEYVRKKRGSNYTTTGPNPGNGNGSPASQAFSGNRTPSYPPTPSYGPSYTPNSGYSSDRSVFGFPTR